MSCKNGGNMPLNKTLVFLGAMLFVASLCYGATITGTVKGPDGNPFEGAFVQAQNAKTRITVSVLSGKDGRYPSGEATDRGIYAADKSNRL